MPGAFATATSVFAADQLRGRGPWGGKSMRKELGRGAEPRAAELCLEKRGAVLTVAFVATLLAAGGARAQQIASPAPQFDSTGFIQAATLDGSVCPDVAPMLWGGTVTVNGIKM